MKEIKKFDMAVAVETTLRCNLRCKTCFQKTKASKDIPLEDVRKVVDYAVNLREYLSLNNIMITLTGGEPLLFPHLLESASYAHEKGLVTSLVTNGTLLSPDKARELKEAGISWIAVSLDGPNQDVLSAVRNVEFDAVMQAITSCIELGFYTSVSYTVTNVNKSYLREMAELFQPLGLDQIHFNHFVPLGYGRDNSEELAPDIDTNRDVQTRIRHLFIEFYYKGLFISSGCPTFGLTDTKFPFRMETLLNAKVQGVQVPKCTLGYNVTVTPTGEVITCIMLRDTSLGNIKERDLISIWNDPISRGYREGTFLKGRCRICEHANICRGCRGRALGLVNDMFAEDPLCWHIPGVPT
jgi:radical SAM protein with 4Fe4S-binding SPASM domain